MSLSVRNQALHDSLNSLQQFTSCKAKGEKGRLFVETKHTDRGSYETISFRKKKIFDKIRQLFNFKSNLPHTLEKLALIIEQTSTDKNEWDRHIKIFQNAMNSLHPKKYTEHKNQVLRATPSYVSNPSKAPKPQASSKTPETRRPQTPKKVKSPCVSKFNNLVRLKEKFSSTTSHLEEIKSTIAVLPRIYNQKQLFGLLENVQTKINSLEDNFKYGEFDDCSNESWYKAFMDALTDCQKKLSSRLIEIPTNREPKVYGQSRVDYF
jgi:hypothetical protein